MYKLGIWSLESEVLNFALRTSSFQFEAKRLLENGGHHRSILVDRSIWQSRCGKRTEGSWNQFLRCGHSALKWTVCLVRMKWTVCLVRLHHIMIHKLSQWQAWLKSLKLFFLYKLTVITRVYSYNIRRIHEESSLFSVRYGTIVQAEPNEPT